MSYDPTGPALLSGEPHAPLMLGDQVQWVRERGGSLHDPEDIALRLPKYREASVRPLAWPDLTCCYDRDFGNGQCPST